MRSTPRRRPTRSIYSIYYVDSKAYGGADWANRAARSVLLEMSEQTGGRFFRVDRKHPLQANIRSDPAGDAQPVFALEFISSDSAKDGRYRRLEVFLRDPNLKAQARKGYFAPKASESE